MSQCDTNLKYQKTNGYKAEIMLRAIGSAHLIRVNPCIPAVYGYGCAVWRSVAKSKTVRTHDHDPFGKYRGFTRAVCRLCNATQWPFLAIRKSKFAPPSNLKHRFGPVRTRPNGFRKVHNNLNHGPNLAFGSGWSPDFELNFSQVHISSGSNFGSEPDCGSTRGTQTLQIQ